MRPLLVCVLLAPSLAACGHEADGGPDIAAYLPGGRAAQHDNEAENQREYDQWREADRLRDECYRNSDSRKCPR
jgi:hypothetical protein